MQKTCSANATLRIGPYNNWLPLKEKQASSCLLWYQMTRRQEAEVGRSRWQLSQRVGHWPTDLFHSPSFDPGALEYHLSEFCCNEDFGFLSVSIEPLVPVFSGFSNWGSSVGLSCRFLCAFEVIGRRCDPILSGGSMAEL